MPSSLLVLGPRRGRRPVLGDRVWGGGRPRGSPGFCMTIIPDAVDVYKQKSKIFRPLQRESIVRYRGLFLYRTLYKTSGHAL